MVGAKSPAESPAKRLFDGSPLARDTPYLRGLAPPRFLGKRPCGPARFSNFVACGRPAFSNAATGSLSLPPLPGIVSARLFDPAARPRRPVNRESIFAANRARGRDRADPDFRPDSYGTPTDRRGRRRRFRSRFAVRCFPSTAIAATDDCHRHPTGLFVFYRSYLRSLRIYSSIVRAIRQVTFPLPSPAPPFPPGDTESYSASRAVDRNRRGRENGKFEPRIPFLLDRGSFIG